MDANVKSAMAIDSSVRSLASSFGQLDMNPVISGGPINRLPNEMMQFIMAKLDLDGEVKKLIPLRLVCTKWRALLLEDYCRLKKSLAVFMDNGTGPSDDDFQQIKRRFFGLVNLNKFSQLYLSAEIPSKCVKSLLKLFPNIVQLSIHCAGNLELYSLEFHMVYSKVPDFAIYINSLKSLKQLDIKGPFAHALPNLYSTLNKLEHFSFDPPFTGLLLKDEDHLRLISKLSPGCVRVHLTENLLLNNSPILQWHRINPHWLANVTHLEVAAFEETNANQMFAQAVHLLSEHTSSLKLLNFISSGSPPVLTPTVIDDFAKLSHLTELELTLEIFISDWVQAADQHRLASLRSVLTLNLWAFDSGEPALTADSITRVLAIIFPNLVELNLLIDCDTEADLESLDLAEIQQYSMDRFKKLVKHNIELCC